jgi:hypothetical protein
MNTQIDMTKFHELLNDETAESQLMTALRKLLEVSEPKSITEAKGPEPLGVWSGWAIY